MHGTHRYAHRPVAPPSPHTRTHLSGRGCISGVKCGRQREEYQRRGSCKNAPVFGFSSWWVHPSTPASGQPALWHKNKAKTSDPCKCASHHSSLLGCWATWIHASDASRTTRCGRLGFSAHGATHKITRLHCKHALVNTQTFGSTCMGSRLKIHQNNNSRNGNVEWLPEKVFKIKPTLPS